jgi:hypothetical protein
MMKTFGAVHPLGLGGAEWYEDTAVPFTKTDDRMVKTSTYAQCGNRINVGHIVTRCVKGVPPWSC